MTSGWAAVIIAGAVACAGFNLWMARHAWRLIRRVLHFLDDYFGEPARDGLPARPGVVARLEAVEQLTAQVAAEMKPNGGASLRDDVQAIGRDVAQIKTDQAGLRKCVDAIRERGGS